MDAFRTMFRHFRAYSFCSTTIIATVVFLLVDFVAAQAATSSTGCGGCEGILEVSAVLVGSTLTKVEPVSTGSSSLSVGPRVTRTISCAQLTVSPPATGIGFTDCPALSQSQGDSTLTMDDGQILVSVSALAFIDVYRSVGRVMYDSTCLRISTEMEIKPAITIGASNAHLTTVTESLTFGSTESQPTRSLILDATLLQSFGTTCGTPAAWLQAATPTSMSKRLASTFLPESDNGLAGPSRAVVGAILGVGVCLWLGFLAFFIWRRRSHEKIPDKSNITSQDERLSFTNLRRDRGGYLKIPGISSFQRQTTSKSLRHRENWKAPLIMISGLVCGLAFAIGHHFLYQSLNGQPITNFQTAQTWYLRVGNLLAILVKLSFTISIGAAFVQLQWMKLYQVAFSVRDVDAMSSVLMNVFSLLDSLVWLRFPSLTLLAASFWLMSLTPIFTPGTLNVRPLSFQNTTYVQVPQLDFSNATQWIRKFGGADYDQDAIGSVAVRQIALATAVGGQILPLGSYSPNGTYLLDFYGPALKCLDASNDVQEVFNGRYANYEDGPNNSMAILDYISTVFLPTAKDLVDGNTPIYIDVLSSDSSRIYIAIRNSKPGAPVQTVSVTECGLYNGNYRVQFSFQGTNQDVSVLSVNYLEGVSFNKFLDIYFDASFPPDFTSVSEKQNQWGSYLGLMSALGSVLVGAIIEAPSRETLLTNVELLKFDYSNLPSDKLQNKIQELFQNMTISMLSNSDFHKNSTEAGWIRVDDQVSLISYAYDSLDLIITYGLAFILTEICILFGLYAVMQNNGSYQNRFSTFLRATKNDSELRKYTDANAGDNATEPRPKALAKAIVEFSQPQKQQDTWLRDYPRQDIVRRRSLARVEDDCSESQ